MPDFNPAFPRPVKWSVGDNRYDEGGKNPKALNLFVPLESAQALARYINAMATDPEKIKKGKVWDYALSAEVEVDGIYINAKGKDGNYGAYGTLNPPAPQSSDISF